MGDDMIALGLGLGGIVADPRVSDGNHAHGPGAREGVLEVLPVQVHAREAQVFDGQVAQPRQRALRRHGPARHLL